MQGVSSCFWISSLPFAAILSDFYLLFSLLDPKHFLLPLLGGKFPLEAAVGVNGRVWVSAKEPKQIIAIARCIEAVDPDGGGMDPKNVKTFLGTLDI